MDYFELSVELIETEPWREILIAELADEGFESFVETNTGFQGYIPENLINQEQMAQLLQREFVKSYTFSKIESQNWNAEWEKNFDPVFVDEKLAIIAPFHEVPQGYETVITIMPKMSFGTGHHQTTWLMSQKIMTLDLNQKVVLDMGTGTGILAILAEKYGAAEIVAIDNDSWSYENALENVEKNNCHNVKVLLGEEEQIDGKIFHIVIANINKNVLSRHFSVYSASLISGGKLLISGFFETDKADLINAASNHGLIFESMNTRDGWALIELIKQ